MNSRVYNMACLDQGFVTKDETIFRALLRYRFIIGKACDNVAESYLSPTHSYLNHFRYRTVYINMVMFWIPHESLDGCMWKILNWYRKEHNLVVVDS